MSQPAIRVEGLGKRFRIGSRQRYKALRDTLAEMARVPFRAPPIGIRGKAGLTAPESSDYIWALRGVSFELKRGEALGIVGPNGAGKTTLLKILSRITEPSEGFAEVHGRIGSLLEVGTGFHPELTGRDNVFLNGSILGMKRAEIKRKFSEIVEFAEVERFIDTPVKHYSSGMHVRLAFAVAAHLGTDVLAVDEVLAVGDASFQKKCLNKMDEVRSGQGRTVLFVSHNLGAVRLLTNTCLFVNQGRLVEFGQTDEVLNRYLQTCLVSDGNGFVDLSSPTCRRGTQKRLELNIRFESLRLVNSQGETTSSFYEREAITVEMTFCSTIQARAAEFIVVVLNLDGLVVYSGFSGKRCGMIGAGLYRISCRMDPNILRPGHYRLRLYLRDGDWQDIIAEAATFAIEPNPVEGEELSYLSTHPGLMGMVRVEFPWGEPVRVNGDSGS